MTHDADILLEQAAEALKNKQYPAAEELQRRAASSYVSNGRRNLELRMKSKNLPIFTVLNASLTCALISMRTWSKCFWRRNLRHGVLR